MFLYLYTLHFLNSARSVDCEIPWHCNPESTSNCMIRHCNFAYFLPSRTYINSNVQALMDIFQAGGGLRHPGRANIPEPDFESWRKCGNGRPRACSCEIRPHGTVSDEQHPHGRSLFPCNCAKFIYLDPMPHSPPIVSISAVWSTSQHPPTPCPRSLSPSRARSSPSCCGSS